MAKIIPNGCEGDLEPGFRTVLYYVANIFFATYCFSPVLGGLFFRFSSRIAYRGPGIGRMKMPLAMDGPLGQ